MPERVAAPTVILEYRDFNLEKILVDLLNNSMLLHLNNIYNVQQCLTLKYNQDNELIYRFFTNEQMQQIASSEEHPEYPYFNTFDEAKQAFFQ